MTGWARSESPSPCLLPLSGRQTIARSDAALAQAIMTRIQVLIVTQPAWQTGRPPGPLTTLERLGPLHEVAAHSELVVKKVVEQEPWEGAGGRSERTQGERANQGRVYAPCTGLPPTVAASAYQRRFHSRVLVSRGFRPTAVRAMRVLPHPAAPPSLGPPALSPPAPFCACR